MNELAARQRQRQELEGGGDNNGGENTRAIVPALVAGAAPLPMQVLPLVSTEDPIEGFLSYGPDFTDSSVKLRATALWAAFGVGEAVAEEEDISAVQDIAGQLESWAEYKRVASSRIAALNHELQNLQGASQRRELQVPEALTMPDNVIDYLMVRNPDVYLYNKDMVEGFQETCKEYKEAREQARSAIMDFQQLPPLPQVPRDMQMDLDTQKAKLNTLSKQLMGSLAYLAHEYGTCLVKQKLLDTQEAEVRQAEIERAKRRKIVEEGLQKEEVAESKALLGWGKICMAMYQLEAQQPPIDQQGGSGFGLGRVLGLLDPQQTQDQEIQELHDIKKKLEETVARMTMESENAGERIANAHMENMRLKKLVEELEDKLKKGGVQGGGSS